MRCKISTLQQVISSSVLFQQVNYTVHCLLREAGSSSPIQEAHQKVYVNFRKERLSCCRKWLKDLKVMPLGLRPSPRWGI